MDNGTVSQYMGHIYWLAVLAEQGSYTAAATRLNVSKSAVSQRLSELERVAGIALVRRTTRSVRLTEAGQQLVDMTQQAFNQIADSFQSVRDLTASPQGTLRLSAPVALGRQHLVPALPTFLRQYPGIRIELELTDQLVALSTEGIDVAIRHTNHPPELDVAIPLCLTESVLVASPGYIAEASELRHPSDLALHPCLHYPRRNRAVTWVFEPRKGRTSPITVAVRSPLAVNNSEALRTAALAGLGIALVPDFSVSRQVADQTLLRLLPEWKISGNFGDRLYAIRPYAKHVPKATRLMLEYLKELFKNESY
ncbi:MAG: LysR family transcriptional regulator [Pusillimonas sp.]|nr:LysR family transcriptional regulator [Pusillimonas sp.]MBC44049.1 LysR family transcriptional regulator [Pusillimonas sp.]HCN73691.1 LysR family transcriptional regulator [Pusillimonas sp.]HCP79014.1 LysR family transcriptional regulator [Pusillimonas sp.]